MTARCSIDIEFLEPLSVMQPYDKANEAVQDSVVSSD